MAIRNRWGKEIPFYDDYPFEDGQVFILCDSISILGVVRARSWETAFEICEDEFFPEASETIDELIAEYGFKREHKMVIKSETSIPESERPAQLGAFEKFAEYPADYPDGKLAATFVRWVTIETPDPDAWPENELFQEAFGFRPNGPNARDTVNHGIYTKDLNGESLDLLTLARDRQLGKIELLCLTTRWRLLIPTTKQGGSDMSFFENDADYEQAELERRGRLAARRRRQGICTHGSVTGYLAEPIYPEQVGLKPGEHRCTSGCGQVFTSYDAWLDAMHEALDG